MGTFQFYEENAIDLIQRYDNANMKKLHQLLSKYIHKADKVLDIGIGSGREIQFLYDLGCKVWGIDPTIAFIQNAQKRFPDIQEHFMISSLPELSLKKKFLDYFDAIISIAVWMHLKKKDYKESVENIVSMTKPTGKIILSYSIGKRVLEDSRYFEDVDTAYLIELFQQKDFYLCEQIGTTDGLGRTKELSWITLVFAKNQVI